jgi:hypothetical protein
MPEGPQLVGDGIAARGYARHRRSAAQPRRAVLCTASGEHALVSRRRTISKAAVATWAAGAAESR